MSGKSVRLVRLPTSKALEKLTVSVNAPEFDVFIGGPAEAYEQARVRGIITPHQLSDIADPDFSTEYWLGTYGGILGFCIDPQRTPVNTAPHSWAELQDPRFHRQLILPSPLTSGTASTMIGTLNEIFPIRSDYLQYLRTLHTNTLTYTDSGTHLVNLIADGQAAVAVTFAPYCNASAEAHLKVIYPSDGTGYEVGGAAIVRGGNFRAAQDFLRFAVSDSGQALVASIENQNPLSRNLPNNLAASLAALKVPVYDLNTANAGSQRMKLIELFAREVLYD
ncbi:iron(III) transport system substrate-binding protein [Arcanobacterium hippocoleae]|uniref:Iron(III) transport system substrate-binding protein n=2 Tax=Arcanobacterium hippocoleae TaxID=149017 RepID=A0ABU1T3B3_9ACTO|nr:iron(III) transport system substrate-binding protein [Arcanobacterium hippocoleae]